MDKLKDIKKFGIVADNYKVDKFKEKLTEDGFTFKVKPGISEDNKNIVVEATAEQLPEIKNICDYVELYFKRSN